VSRPRFKNRAAKRTQDAPGRQAYPGWCDRLHTAEDITGARAALVAWSARTGNTDVAASMTEDITRRAIDLGLETV
jgi:hypothetical protein